MSQFEPTLSEMRDELRALREVVEAQQAELASLRARPAAAPAAPVARADRADGAPTAVTRRRMLTVAGATAAAAGVSVLGRPGVAAAADPNDVVLGSENNATTRTAINAPGSAGALAVRTTGAGAEPALEATSESSFGAVLAGKDSQLRIRPRAGQTDLPTGNHLTGELFLSADGFLALKTADSAFDSDWTLLNTIDPVTVFSLPERAYDSRDARYAAAGPIGIFGSDDTRVIDLEALGIPAGVVSAVLNVTVTKTVGAGGFVAVYSADITVADPQFSLVNWYGPNQTVANSGEFGVSDGKVKVFAKRGTHVIVDVMAIRFPV